MPWTFPVSEKHTYGQTASDTDPAVTWRDIQGASDPCSLIEKKNRQKTYFFKKNQCFLDVFDKTSLFLQIQFQAQNHSCAGCFAQV